MIIEEKPYIDEQGENRKNLVKHYSDRGVMILQLETGIRYAEAIDVIPCRYTYEETDEPIEPMSDEATPEDYEAALERFGAK